MKFIARGLLFSTQRALGHVADVKDAVGFADIWIPFSWSWTSFSGGTCPKADFARSAPHFPQLARAQHGRGRSRGVTKENTA